MENVGVKLRSRLPMSISGLVGQIRSLTLGGGTTKSSGLLTEGSSPRHVSSTQLVAATAFCRAIGLGAMFTALVMVLYSQSLEATTDDVLVDSIVHISNVKFMATMWFVTGVLFVVGAPNIYEDNTWRLLRIGCIGISFAAVVRIIEMARFDDWSGYALTAAAIELVVPPSTIWLRHRALSSGSENVEEQR